MLQPGRYTARAVEAALGHTSKGTEQVAVLFEVVFDDGSSERITWYGYFTEKTVDRTFESLQLCGCTGEPPFDFDNIGRNEVSIEVRNEADQDGNMRPRVKWVNKLGAAGVALKDRMGEDQAAIFAKKMRGQFAAYKAKGGGGNGAAPPAPKPPRQPGEDDDVPW